MRRKWRGQLRTWSQEEGVGTSDSDEVEERVVKCSRERIGSSPNLVNHVI